MREQIKSRSAKLVDSLGNIRCFKWSHMRVFMICTQDSPIYIVNSLKALGNTFTNCEKVKKIIRLLPKEWRPKGMAIEEAKNLNTLSIDDLIGSLISYEEDITNERIDEDKKKKSFAFKSSIVKSDDDGSDFEDEGIEIIARKFRRIFKKQIKIKKL